MKLKHLFFLPLALMLVAGCMKSQDPITTTAPVGTFSGNFLRLHKKASGNGYDSLKAVVTLTLDPQTGFKLTGDTTQHAGSFGGYNYDQTYFLFSDKTVSTTNTKVHLNGYYLYATDGSRLQLQQTYADTLGFFYDLKKN
jgi:hypothetical protein